MQKAIVSELKSNCDFEFQKLKNDLSAKCTQSFDKISSKCNEHLTTIQTNNLLNYQKIDSEFQNLQK